jgi:DNA mismatch repair ATPase MutL
LHEKGV